ncbi:MAG: thiamine diphosphokinase [Candidatus Neomarinimicrobiota bacterium]
MTYSQHPYDSVVLANGPFPVHSIPLSILKHANQIICTDGSADKLIKAGMNPSVIIGDMDSITMDIENSNILVNIDHDEQNTDLEKALNWCRDQKINKIALLGAFGDREDHSFGNFILIARYDKVMEIDCITDHSIINPFSGTRKFDSFSGQLVSLLTFEKINSITTLGLKYSLDHEILLPSSRGISNRALGENFQIKSSSQVWVIRSHE